MEIIKNNMQFNAKLQIVFLKSSEDHRLQLVKINGSLFAIIHSPLESLGPIRLQCENWSIILLAPVKSKTNIVISAINLICLNEIVSEEGNVSLHASYRLVKFANMIKPTEKFCAMGECGEFEFDDDPGAILFYYRLFDSIVENLRIGGPDTYSEAQQKFIMSLCTLADKIEGKPENLTLHKVLDIWDIPHLKHE
jgi:hypothetical protein